MSEITDIDNDDMMEDDIPSLEADIIDLKGQLKGVINADMAGEVSRKLVPYISEREKEDPLVTLDGRENRSRWANAVKPVEVEVAGTRGCCVLC